MQSHFASSRSNRTAGYVPSMFLQPYQNPHNRFLTLAQSSLCVSTPNLSEAISPGSKKSSRRDASYAHSTDRAWEGQDMPLRRARSQSPSRNVGIASSGLIAEGDSSSDSSGNLSEEGLFYQPQKSEIKKGGNDFPKNSLEHSSASTDSSLSPLASKLRSDSGFEEEPFVCPENPLCSFEAKPMPGSPRVPPRPSTQEILQRCTTITKKTVQGAGPKLDPLAC